MRRARIEVVTTPGTQAVASVYHRGQTHTLESIFESQGFRLRVTRRNADAGGRTSFGIGDLHRLMTTVSRARGSWEATALVVPEIQLGRPGRLRAARGVMFDVGEGDLDGTPRQGCAIAFGQVRGDPAGSLRTLAHEVGHVFNLLHPEDQGKPLGTTVMNQTTTLQRGDYPANIALSLDEHDRDWLDHAPEANVRPGGTPFRGPSSFDAVPDPALRLVASVDRSEVPCGQPQSLRLRLRNDGPEAVSVPSAADVVTGELVIEDAEQARPTRGSALVCTDPDTIELAAGRELRWSVPVPAELLAQPGRRLVRARLRDGLRWIASEPVELWLVDPEELDDEPLWQPGPRWIHRFVEWGGWRLDPGEHDTLWSILAAHPHAPQLDDLRLTAATSMLREHGPGRAAAELIEAIDPERLDAEQRAAYLVARAQTGETDELRGPLLDLRDELGRGDAWVEQLIEQRRRK